MKKVHKISTLIIALMLSVLLFMISINKSNGKNYSVEKEYWNYTNFKNELIKSTINEKNTEIPNTIGFGKTTMSEKVNNEESISSANVQNDSLIIGDVDLTSYPIVKYYDLYMPSGKVGYVYLYQKIEYDGSIDYATYQTYYYPSYYYNLKDTSDVAKITNNVIGTTSLSPKYQVNMIEIESDENAESSKEGTLIVANRAYNGSFYSNEIYCDIAAVIRVHIVDPRTEVLSITQPPMEVELLGNKEEGIVLTDKSLQDAKYLEDGGAIETTPPLSPKSFSYGAVPTLTVTPKSIGKSIVQRRYQYEKQADFQSLNVGFITEIKWDLTSAPSYVDVVNFDVRDSSDIPIQQTKEITIIKEFIEINGNKLTINEIPEDFRLDYNYIYNGQITTGSLTFENAIKDINDNENPTLMWKINILVDKRNSSNETLLSITEINHDNLSDYIWLKQKGLNEEDERTITGTYQVTSTDNLLNYNIKNYYDKKQLNYIVEWYDEDTNEHIKESETRHGIINEIVEVTSEDKIIEGYTFNPDNKNNIMGAKIDENDITLRLYFKKSKSEQENPVTKDYISIVIIISFISLLTFLFFTIKKRNSIK